MCPSCADPIEDASQVSPATPPGPQQPCAVCAVSKLCSGGSERLATCTIRAETRWGRELAPGKAFPKAIPFCLQLSIKSARPSRGGDQWVPTGPISPWLDSPKGRHLPYMSCCTHVGLSGLWQGTHQPRWGSEEKGQCMGPCRPVEQRTRNRHQSRPSSGRDLAPRWQPGSSMVEALKQHMDQVPAEWCFCVAPSKVLRVLYVSGNRQLLGLSLPPVG